MSNKKAGPPLVACMGELLVDFFAKEEGVEVGRATTFVKAPGGAMANVAVGVRRLGLGSRFIGKVGSDPFGRFLKDNLAGTGVDVAWLKESNTHQTGLVFVALDAKRVPSFCFYGKPSADMTFAEKDISRDMLKGAAFLHVGTVSMVREPALGATLELMRLAREMKVHVSFDPNLRFHLFKDHDKLRRLARKAIAVADLVKLNHDELFFLTGESDVEKGAENLLDLGPRLVVVTLGEDGAYWKGGGGSGRVPGHRVKVVDTTGAGDGFAAGLLAGLCEARWFPGPGEIGAAVRFGNAVGALAVTAMGAVSSLPTREEALKFMAGPSNRSV